MRYTLADVERRHARRILGIQQARILPQSPDRGPAAPVRTAARTELQVEVSGTLYDRFVLGVHMIDDPDAVRYFG
jgi:hypothetical protein